MGVGRYSGIKIWIHECLNKQERNSSRDRRFTDGMLIHHLEQCFSILLLAPPNPPHEVENILLYTLTYKTAALYDANIAGWQHSQNRIIAGKFQHVFAKKNSRK